MMQFQELESLLKLDRSVRRFDQSQPVDPSTLERLVGLTRYCASGRNAQPLKYVAVSSPEMCALVYPTLAWAGYYKDWDGPVEGERPTAYLIQCVDTDLTQNLLCDDGLQLQAITLGATALGLSGCIIKSFNAPKLAAILNLPPRYRLHYVLALGHGIEQVQLEPLDPDGDIKYYRTPDSVHHVPKRPLSTLLISVEKSCS